MNKTRIILVRHGETTWNKEGRYQGQVDTPLSDFGLAQGNKLAEALANIKIDKFYASHLFRAKETARLCATLHKQEVAIDERLQEISHGAWEGLLAEDVAKTYPQELKDWQNNPAKVLMPGGEDLAIVVDRSMAALEEIAQNNIGKTVLVAAHDAVNKVVICRALGIDLNKFWQIKQDNTCINVLEFCENSWRIVLLNSTLHMGFLFSGIEQKGL